MDPTEPRLPLGLCKQASMKLEAFASDVYEILEDEALTPEEKEIFQTMRELSATMMAQLINIVRKECSEEGFLAGIPEGELLAEQVPMDAIDPWPDGTSDIMDQNIE